MVRQHWNDEVVMFKSDRLVAPCNNVEHLITKERFDFSHSLGLVRVLLSLIDKAWANLSFRVIQ